MAKNTSPGSGKTRRWTCPSCKRLTGPSRSQEDQKKRGVLCGRCAAAVKRETAS